MFFFNNDFKKWNKIVLIIYYIFYNYYVYFWKMFTIFFPWNFLFYFDFNIFLSVFFILLWFFFLFYFHYFLKINAIFEICFLRHFFHYFLSLPEFPNLQLSRGEVLHFLYLCLLVDTTVLINKINFPSQIFSPWKTGNKIRRAFTGCLRNFNPTFDKPNKWRT